MGPDEEAWKTSLHARTLNHFRISLSRAWFISHLCGWTPDGAHFPITLHFASRLRGFPPPSPSSITEAIIWRSKWMFLPQKPDAFNHGNRNDLEWILSPSIASAFSVSPFGVLSRGVMIWIADIIVGRLVTQPKRYTETSIKLNFKVYKHPSYPYRLIKHTLSVIEVNDHWGSGIAKLWSVHDRQCYASCNKLDKWQQRRRAPKREWSDNKTHFCRLFTIGGRFFFNKFD